MRPRGVMNDPRSPSSNLRQSGIVSRQLAATGVIRVLCHRNPKARLVPPSDHAKPRQPAGWEGKVWVAEDFDEPLPADILAGFEGRD
jgi:hypothetical protein